MVHNSFIYYPLKYLINFMVSYLKIDCTLYIQELTPDLQLVQ